MGIPCGWAVGIAGTYTVGNQPFTAACRVLSGEWRENRGEIRDWMNGKIN